jgi:hypothetical protein
MKIRAFWDVAPCSLGIDLCFGGAYCLHHHCDHSSHLWNVSLLWDYTALHSSRLYLHEDLYRVMRSVSWSWWGYPEYRAKMLSITNLLSVIPILGRDLVHWPWCVFAVNISTWCSVFLILLLITSSNAVSNEWFNIGMARSLLMLFWTLLQGPGWSYETELPDWARVDWTEQDDWAVSNITTPIHTDSYM